MGRSPSFPPQQASNSVQSHSRGPVLWGVAPAGAVNARTRVSAASIHSQTWAAMVEWIESEGWPRHWTLCIPTLDIFYY